MLLIKWYAQWKSKKLAAAYLDGYGWAWAAWRIEGVSLQEISHYILHPYEGAFSAGAMQAMLDIEQLTINRQPLSNTLVSPA